MYIFPPALFKFQSETRLRKLEARTVVIIGGHDLNDIRCEDNIALNADSKKMAGNLREYREEKVAINCKKTELMAINQETTQGQGCTLET